MDFYANNPLFKAIESRVYQLDYSYPDCWVASLEKQPARLLRKTPAAVCCASRGSTYCTFEFVLESVESRQSMDNRQN